jgi:hypothetical protein
VIDYSHNENWREQPKKLIFVHSALDQAGLDVYEFRLLGHIARRGSCLRVLTQLLNFAK